MVAKQEVIKTKRGPSSWEHECAQCIAWQFGQFSNLMTKTREVVVQIFSQEKKKKRSGDHSNQMLYPLGNMNIISKLHAL